MTMKLTKNRLDEIDKTFGLKGYPKSKYLAVGWDLYHAKQCGLATDAWKNGAEKDGCVGCMFFYVDEECKRNNIHLAIPWALEGAIRGYDYCIQRLATEGYNKTTPATSEALSNYWEKVFNEVLNSTDDTDEEKRKEIKKINMNMCTVCGKEDSKDRSFEKCGKCKYYSYCGKECQEIQWKKYNHIAECRQLTILRQYCKPRYVKEIRENIIRGDDPKTINRLQTIRTKLGLNRPKEEYEELVLLLNDTSNNIKNKNNHIVKQGTRVMVKGLVKAPVHNGKCGIVTKLIVGEGRRVGVKLLDDSGTVLAIKRENLVRPNPYEYLTARKNGTVHIGSTQNVI